MLLSYCRLRRSPLLPIFLIVCVDVLGLALILPLLPFYSVPLRTQIGSFIGFLILAYANQLWLVFLSRIIDGLTAGNLSLAQAYISDVTKPEERAKSFALIGIAFGMGFLVGPGVSGYLAGFSYQLPIFAAAGLSFTSILCTYFLLPAHPPHADAAAERKFTILGWGRYVEFF